MRERSERTEGVKKEGKKESLEASENYKGKQRLKRGKWQRSPLAFCFCVFQRAPSDSSHEAVGWEDRLFPARGCYQEAGRQSELWWPRIPAKKEEQRSESCTSPVFPSKPLPTSEAAQDRRQDVRRKASKEQRVVLRSFSMLRRQGAWDQPQ